MFAAESTELHILFEQIFVVDLLCVMGLGEIDE